LEKADGKQYLSQTEAFLGRSCDPYPLSTRYK
jgi:hypothetical protein